MGYAKSRYDDFMDWFLHRGMAVRLAHAADGGGVPVYARGMTAGLSSETLPDGELAHLRRCVELAEEALAAGDEPFGSVLVDSGGVVLAEDRNRIAGGDSTRHPEFELARWAAENMTPKARAAATVYTSGEHCPMCAAAHGWVGLGRIVYACSSAQLADWLTELGVPAPPVTMLPIASIAPHVQVVGPVPQFAGAMRALHARCHGGSAAAASTR